MLIDARAGLDPRPGDSRHHPGRRLDIRCQSAVHPSRMDEIAPLVAVSTHGLVVF